MLALYKSAATKTGVACFCELSFAVYAGAALSLIPKAATAEALRAGALSDVLAENFHEVLNVLTTTLNQSGAGHFALDQVIPPPAKLSPPLLKRLLSPHERRNAVISIENYGEGQLILVKFALV